jgi:signal transduction histidine kinase
MITGAIARDLQESVKVNSEAPTQDRIILCPQCENPLPKDARICLECGVDLALYALLAERAYLEGLPEASPIAATPEALVPRIGEYLLDQGLLSPEELEKALQEQKSLAKEGKKILLGQTLVQMGLVDRETLDRAITHQIIELHAALQESNRTLERRVNERTADLRHALERVREVNQIKANLISNISHELRTPLAHIKGYSELIVEEQLGSLNPEQVNAVQVIQRASDRLGNLIEDLIQFSTASREGLKLNIQAVVLPEVANEVLARSLEKAKKAGVSLESNIGDGLPPVSADKERISWVLFQLIDNGIKFTPSGGNVQLSARLNNQKVVLAVIDSGIGIPEDRVKEIFEPFHQLDGSATRRYGGTGLGLALVKLILDSHDSMMLVESVEDRGSKFSFPLPVAGAAE